MPDTNKPFSLFEWYEALQDAPVHNVDDIIKDFTKGPSMDEPEVTKQAVAVEVKKEEPKPAEKEEKLENWSEMFKCMAIVNALSHKLSMLSGAFTITDEEKKKVKDDIKIMVKKISEIVNAI
jgi:predicted DNA-binding protein YlxM (UPF0122 family)